MSEKLTDRDYWNKFWSNVSLPNIAKPETQVTELYKRHLPESTDLTLFEVGCAPGGWLSYFKTTFSYEVSGIEYAHSAAEATRRNFDIQGMDPGNVIEGDFFEYKADKRYDIVFSRGFIEHFENTQEVVDQIVQLSCDYVITIIPNLFGMNGWISKTFRREVYDKHILISKYKLKELHVNSNVDPLFCDYSNEFRISKLFEKNDFAKKNPKISKLLNAPVQLVNKLMNVLSIHPSTRLFSPSIMFIGRKIK